MNYDDLVQRLQTNIILTVDDIEGSWSKPDITVKLHVCGVESKDHVLKVGDQLTLLAQPEAADAIQALQKDALRYRWLRGADHDWWDARIISLFAGPDYARLCEWELDAAIDEAMQHEAG